MAERGATAGQARLAIPECKRARPRKAQRLSAAKIAKIAGGGIPSSEAARLLDTTQPWLAELVRRGDLQALETPLGRLYDRADVLRLAEARRIAQAGRPRRGRPRKDDPRYQQEALSA
jgi:hypothetical protein